MFAHHSKLPLGLAAVATLFLLHVSANAETMEEIYTKAKLEKTLVLYAGGPVSNYEPLAREFEQKFPGLTVTMRSVAAGKDFVTIDATTSTILNLKKAGQPIEYAFSKDDPIPVYCSTAG